MEDGIVIEKACEESEETTEIIEKIETRCDTSSKNTDQFKLDEENIRLTEEDGWLDIIGTGEFKKRVIQTGKGIDTRPTAKDLVTVNYTCYDSSDVLIEEQKNFQLISGDFDVVEGFDLVVNLMEDGEKAEVLIPSRLAYGSLGRQPNFLPDSNLRYIIEILKVEKIDEEAITASKVLHFGNWKRDRGNFWYDRGQYRQAIHCYNRAAEYLDSEFQDSDADSDVLQNILDTRLKVYNNSAAAQMKIEAYDQALKSVNCVLRIQPKNVKALFRKTKILSAKGLIDEAHVCIKKAASLEPETKVIQQELMRITAKKQKEEKDQREMYKRMFPSSNSKSSSSKAKKWLKHWTVMAGSCCVALAVGIAAYRQYVA